MSLLFSWDPAKAMSNAKKHGICFPEARGIFEDPLSQTTVDPDHSQWEQRYITIGLAKSGRFLAVAHADRGDTIRLISARLMTRAERKRYEDG